MSHDPNDQQWELIESLDGIYLVDAGAGTGKTFTVSRRYGHLLAERDVTPDDILLITFTRNGAEEMKERIVNSCDYDRAALQDAPIQTFHSLCKEVVEEYGVQTPQYLGIDDTISPAADIVESGVLEARHFERFYATFKDEHPEHARFYPLVHDPSDLLDLIQSLAAKGIFPTAHGWYRDGESLLDGDRNAFMALFEDANTPEGNRQSELRKALGGLKNKTLPDDAPDPEAVRGPRGTKRIDREWGERAFDADQSDLKAFVHDLYHAYLEYALRRNYLNFAFLQMFAYVLLVEEDAIREELAFEYVMVDEFQDTSEIQFKLSLLFARTDNLCVVGDWKQSIYSFQYASVDNIRRFSDRIQRYRAELNQDRPRIPYDVGDITRIELTTNYRSTQPLLDLAEQTLTVPATNKEDVDQSITEEITSLQEHEDKEGPTTIDAYTAEDEIALVLDRIRTLVDNEDYTVQTDDGHRTMDFGDIAVFSRNRQFALDLQDAADKHNIPVAFEGGIELFTTDPAILLLAWLRILHYRHAKRGWAVVLEEAGYTLDETDAILEDRTYPEEMLQFREELDAKEDIGAVAATVYDRYGMYSAVADKVVAVLQRTVDSSYMHLGDIIRFMEDNITSQETYEVDTSTEENMVTVQTIHKAKGLQYPAVILANVNQRRFPDTKGSSATIDYQDPIGLFSRKTFQDGDLPYVYDDWRSQVLTKPLTGDYDEERRLFYVALTRAQNHLTLTAATDDASNFFEHIGIDSSVTEPAPTKLPPAEAHGEELTLAPVTEKTPITLPVHALLDLDEDAGTAAGQGAAFGRALHTFAEGYARGEDVAPRNQHEEHVKAFLDGLKGTLLPEQSGLLPLPSDGRQVTLRGTIDLIHVTDDTVEVIDFKTDADRSRHDQYRRQLSAYAHMVQAAYPDRSVDVSLLYTQEGIKKPVEVIQLDQLAGIIEIG